MPFQIGIYTFCVSCALNFQLPFDVSDGKRLAFPATSATAYCARGKKSSSASNGNGIILFFAQIQFPKMKCLIYRYTYFHDMK